VKTLLLIARDLMTELPSQCKVLDQFSLLIRLAKTSLRMMKIGSPSKPS